jgi:wobble nucleotide-excising tRNase
LKNVSNFRAFQNWVDDESHRPHTFGKVTLVLGANGTCKSTLTEIAWSIQAKQAGGPANPYLAGVRFEVTDGESASVTAADASGFPPLHVFGRPYVEKNLQKAFDEGAEGTALYVLGEENVGLEEEIRELEARVRAAEAELANAESDLKEREGATRSVLDRTKQDVSDELGSYDPNRFNPNTFNIRRARELLGQQRTPLDAGQLDSTRVDLRFRAEDIPSDINFDAPLMSADLSVNVAACAEHNVTSQVIEALASDPNRAKWVEDGLSLHESGDNCAFCLSEIDPKRIGELQRHFDESHKQLMSKLEGVRGLIAIERSQLKEWPAKREHLCSQDKAVRVALDEHHEGLSEYWEGVGAWLDACSQMVEARARHPHESSTWTSPELPSPAIWAPIRQAVADANASLQSRRTSFADTRKAAEQRMLAHVASKHGTEYDAATAMEHEAKTALGHTQASLKALRSALAGQTAKRSSANDGSKLAAALTRDLAGYLGHSDLVVDFVSDEVRSGFEFKRGGAPATNLSEGERNAIALLHFLASTEAIGVAESLADSCIIIDDPVSSLDHDAILAAYSFLNTRLRDQGGSLRCSQLVLLTHNFEFFRLWKDSLSKPLGKDAKDAKAQGVLPHELSMPRAAVLELLMRRRVEQGESIRSPLIRGFGTGLRALTSEYYYLFARACESTYPAGEDLVPLTGNSTRRLLESFLKFRMPAQNDFTQAANDLGSSAGIESEVISVIVKALHGASHREELDLHTATYRAGITREIAAALEFIRRVDAPHFEGMCTATGWAPNSDAV